MSHPSSEEIEVSVFSRGGGEAIAVHVGGGRWLLIDSLNAPSGRPAAEDYLDRIGVVPSSVDAILLTHWHDDHIQGAGNLVKRYSSARVITPATFKHDEFQGYLEAAYPTSDEKRSSGIEELISVFSSVNGRGKTVRTGCVQRLLSGSAPAGYEFWALSPSDVAVDQFLRSLPRWLEAASKGGKLPRPNRNETSVASLVVVGSDLLLLGADLEVISAHDGWHDVLVNGWNGRPPASLVKVPHHGSKNAHLEEMWTDLCVRDVFAALTPWNRKAKLPTQEDVKRILNLTNNAFVASKPMARAAMKQDSLVAGIVRDFGLDFSSKPSDLGHLRFRKRVGSSTSWSVACLGVGSGPLSSLLQKAPSPSP